MLLLLIIILYGQDLSLLSHLTDYIWIAVTPSKTLLMALPVFKLIFT